MIIQSGTKVRTRITVQCTRCGVTHGWTATNEGAIHAEKAAKMMHTLSGWGTILDTGGTRRELCPGCSSAHERWVSGKDLAGDVTVDVALGRRMKGEDE